MSAAQERHVILSEEIIRDCVQDWIGDVLKHEIYYTRHDDPRMVVTSGGQWISKRELKVDDLLFKLKENQIVRNDPDNDSDAGVHSGVHGGGVLAGTTEG